MTRPFAPVADRVDAAIARLNAAPAFVKRRGGSMPASRRSGGRRPLRECDGAERLLGDGIRRWVALEAIDEKRAGRLIAAAGRAGAAFEAFRDWVAHEPPAADRYACGPGTFSTSC